MNNTLLLAIPYRDRAKHLELFLPTIKAYLKKQDIKYKILIVEQTEGKPFNRAKLLNVAFAYTEGKYGWYCFHDVDMLPIASNYKKCKSPTHLATNAEQFGYKMPYDYYFGGVTMFDPENFKKINGYSNNYWGWGAEDDDVYFRCLKMKVDVLRDYGRYRSLDHERKIFKEEYNRNIETLKVYDESFKEGKFNEGLSTLKYSVLNTDSISKNVTSILVDI